MPTITRDRIRESIAKAIDKVAEAEAHVCNCSAANEGLWCCINAGGRHYGTVYSTLLEEITTAADYAFRGMSGAPWTDIEVENLRCWQEAGSVHEFTGDNGETLIPTKDGWVSEVGGPVVQNWAHYGMVDGSWLSSRKKFEEG